jgi:hypothetical protein
MQGLPSRILYLSHDRAESFWAGGIARMRASIATV